jgi:hypothetical protein
MFSCKSYDVLMMILLPSISAAVAYILATNLFTSTIMFFGLPSLYLGLRNKDVLGKVATFSFILSLPMFFFIDTIAEINKQWTILNSILPFRFLGFTTFEDYVWALLWVLFAVLFYENFFDQRVNRKETSAAIKYLIWISVVLILVVCTIYAINPNWLNIPYFYFLAGFTLSVIPTIIFLYHYPKFLGKFAFAALYFFVVLFTFEIIALQNHQWIYPGTFVMVLHIFGHAIPFEEVFFWMFLGAPATICFYEFFDDQKNLK